MKPLYAVVYTDCFGIINTVNLGASGKYVDRDITHDIRVAQEIAEYMTSTIAQMQYRVVKVILEELV